VLLNANASPQFVLPEWQLLSGRNLLWLMLPERWLL
jgi:hypothetical protein